MIETLNSSRQGDLRYIVPSYVGKIAETVRRSLLNNIKPVDITQYITQNEIELLAQQFFDSSRALPGDTIVIQYFPEGTPIAQAVMKLCEREGVQYRMDAIDPIIDAILINTLSDQPEGGLVSHFEQYARSKIDIFDGVDKTVRIRSNPPPALAGYIDRERSLRFSQLTASLRQRSMDGSLHYVVTRIPTLDDALADGVDYGEYIRRFIEGCNQPWDAIKEAQYFLKEKFDCANTLHIRDQNGTDICLDITGQTFANSVTLKNIPGSEIFSAPLKGGVNGTIIAKGKFQYDDSGIIEDITLIIKDGKIIAYDARVGRDGLGKIIERDDQNGEGTRYLGEIGIGTNPHFRKHTLNPLLVEKIGGSFHVAIGSCYSYDRYDGEPVSLKNGNTSHSGAHWDLTTILRGQESSMELYFPDGSHEVVQQNGSWLLEGCEVLNEGWGALDKTIHPQWWKERYPNGYQEDMSIR